MKNTPTTAGVTATTATSNEAPAATTKSGKTHHSSNDEDFDESEDELEPVPKEFADISPHPMEVVSHFQIVSDGSVKTPKYRCKSCKYEFTASSTTRLKQHIMGYEVYSQETPKKVVKDIKECTNPYLPLKEALIIEFNNNRTHKRPRESIGNDGDGDAAQTPKSGRKKSRGSELSKPAVTWNEASVSAREYTEACTKSSFDEQCPEFHYAENPVLAAGTVFKTDSVILEWLETVIGDWVAATNYMAYREGSSLRFAVYEVLKSVTVLSDAFRLFAYTGSFDSAEALVAIDRFTGRNLNHSSMTAETEIPVSIDTTNATQVKELYSAIGRYVNGRGRVDFGVVDRNNGNIKCIVEVSEHLGAISNGSTKLNGFWEMMHDLVHTHYFNGAKSPLFGVLTDYRHWVFFKLEGSEIQYSSPHTLFNGDYGNPEISDNIYALFKLLFEIFNISGSANLKQKSESVAVFKKNYAEAGLLTLKDNLRIAQEIKKKDDEINRLKEELAKLKSKPAK